jgi:hypothetical protein
MHNSPYRSGFPVVGQHAVTVDEAIAIIAAHVQRWSQSASLDARERQQACLSAVGSQERVLAVENLTA